MYPWNLVIRHVSFTTLFLSRKGGKNFHILVRELHSQVDDDEDIENLTPISVEGQKSLEGNPELQTPHNN